MYSRLLISLSAYIYYIIYTHTKTQVNVKSIHKKKLLDSNILYV